MARSPKTEVNVTELRQNLPGYLAEVKKGAEIEVTCLLYTSPSPRDS